jgi:hypothetical protein
VKKNNTNVKNNTKNNTKISIGQKEKRLILFSP